MIDRTKGPLALLGLLLVLGARNAGADQPRLDAPPQVTQGAILDVAWVGPANPRDYVSLVRSGDAGNRYESRLFTDQGNPLRFAAPDAPGPYEIRYVDGYSGQVLARSLLAVVPAHAELTIPNHVDAGARFRVGWKGPDQEGDMVTIVPVDTPAYKYASHAYTGDGNPAELVAPEEPGVYEVRYLSGRKRYRVVGADAILVGNLEASLTAPERVTAGSPVEVRWTGPDNPEDFIIIAQKNAPWGAYESFAYTREGNPLSLLSPDVPGSYQLCYITGGTFQVLATVALEVTPAEASIAVQGEVAARQVFTVGWEGPGNPDDFIGMFRPDSSAVVSFTYTRRGNPLPIEAPDAPGVYEIRYVTGQSRRSLASLPIQVTQAPRPGKLTVSTEGYEKLGTGGPPTVEIILDASASMLESENDRTRFDVAREGIVQSIEQVLPPGTRFALRVLGNETPELCHTSLPIPLHRLNRSESVARLRDLKGQLFARTPIARSLELVAEDLRGTKGPVVVVLVAGGEEDCGGNTDAAVKDLRRAGLNARINVVGLGVKEFARQRMLRELAHQGRGRYFSVSEVGEVVAAMREALGVAFELLDTRGEVVGTGLVDGEAVEVVPGTYAVKILSQPPLSFDKVLVESGKRAVISIGQEEPRG